MSKPPPRVRPALLSHGYHLAHRRYPTRQRPHHPGTGYRNTRILGDRECIRSPCRPSWRQGDPSLISIDGMRRAGHANHAERTTRDVGCDGESSAMGDGPRRNAIDNRTCSQGAGAGVEVGRVPYLHVIMIGGAGAAETSATVAHCSVHEEDTDGVIIAGNRYRSHLGEFERGRIE